MLEEIIAILEEKYIMDGHDNYAEVVKSINQYTALINTKLISLIGDLDTSEARIRSEYEKQIASKDEIIKDLQNQRSTQEALDASKSKDAQTIAEKSLSDAEESLKKSEEAARDKESIIQMLTVKLKESEEKLTGYDELRKSEVSLRDQVSQLSHQNEMLERDLAEQKRAAEQAQELAVEKAAAKMKAEMQEQMSKLRDEKTRLEVQLELLQKKDNKTKA